MNLRGPMSSAVVVGMLALGPGGPASGAAPCLRLARAGMQVQGVVRICPGRYRVPDPQEKGVLNAAASGTRIDLTGVTLESGDSVPSRLTGVGITSSGVDGVTVIGGVVRGYRIGLRIEGGRGHRVSGTTLSGTRKTAVTASAERSDSTDRLDLSHPEVFLQYGGAVVLRRTVGASVTGITARGAQNGILLTDARDSYIADNDLSGNTGWAIHLWRSSHNIILRNQADHSIRCEEAPGACGAAAILLQEQSDSNTIADNRLFASRVGILVDAVPPLVRPSVGNLIVRNDASSAADAGFAAAYDWNTTFLDNRADSAGTGFRLRHSIGSTTRGNSIIGARDTGISVTHGANGTIEANLILGAQVGIWIATPDASTSPGRGFRIDDNVLGGLGQAVVLQGAVDSRVRGNVIDGVDVGLVVDGTGHGTEVSGNVFLRARQWFIAAPDLMAGGNYWATADAAAAAARVRGRISVLPWKPASAAGY